VLDRYLEVPARRRSYQSYLGWLLPRVPFFLAKLMIKPGNSVDVQSQAR